jgi:hypothetical protein
MIINLIYDPSVSALGTREASFESAVGAAAAYLDNLIINPITVNITVGWGESDGQTIAAGRLAAGGPVQGIGMTYAQLVGDLRSSATSALDASAYADLPASDPSGSNHYFISSTQEKAWGIVPATDTAMDGTIGFSATVSWDLDSTNQAVPGEYDLVGVAEQELTHALGRFSGLGANNGWWSAQDLFRYAAPGALQLVPDQSAYFSADDGQTGSNYPFDASGGDDSDWARSVVGDAFDSYPAPGTALTFSQTDINEMDVLGYEISGNNPNYQNTPVAGPAASVADLTTGAVAEKPLVPYSVPGTALHYAFADITPDSLYISTTTPGVFLAAGSGNNILQASAGQNVLSAGTGTNLLIGGDAFNTFFLDGRNPGPSWSTIANFFVGDFLVLWGWQGNVADIQFQDGQGLAGWQGATLHAGLYGTGSNESITFAGLTAAQAANFEMAAGNAGGTPFLVIARS